MQANQFFIYDCNNKVVGNPHGYRTMRGARQQAESRHGKAYRQIWQAYYASEKENPSIELIYKIKTND